VKWLGHEADHSPSSAKVMNVWSYASMCTPPCLNGIVINWAQDVFMAWDLVEHRNNLICNIPFIEQRWIN